MCAVPPESFDDAVRCRPACGTGRLAEARFARGRHAGDEAVARRVQARADQRARGSDRGSAAATRARRAAPAPACSATIGARDPVQEQHVAIGDQRERGEARERAARG